MTQSPTATGLFLCEQVIVEERTRNVTLVNCFSRREVETFPTEPLSFVAFALLSDGIGIITFEVVINRLDNLDEIYRAGVTYHFANRLQTFRFLLRVRDFSFPDPGFYELCVLSGSDTLASRKLLIVTKENLP